MQIGAVALEELMRGQRQENIEVAGGAAADAGLAGASLLSSSRELTLEMVGDAAPAVQDHITRAQRRGEPRTVLLARLLRLRLRALAYRHVKPQRIYSQADALP